MIKTASLAWRRGCKDEHSIQPSYSCDLAMIVLQVPAAPWTLEDFDAISRSPSRVEMIQTDVDDESMTHEPAWLVRIAGALRKFLIPSSVFRLPQFHDPEDVNRRISVFRVPCSEFRSSHEAVLISRSDENILERNLAREICKAHSVFRLPSRGPPEEQVKWRISDGGISGFLIPTALLEAL